MFVRGKPEYLSAIKRRQNQSDSSKTKKVKPANSQYFYKTLLDEISLLQMQQKVLETKISFLMKNQELEKITLQARLQDYLQSNYFMKKLYRDHAKCIGLGILFVMKSYLKRDQLKIFGKLYNNLNLSRYTTYKKTPQIYGRMWK